MCTYSQKPYNKYACKVHENCTKEARVVSTKVAGEWELQWRGEHEGPLAKEEEHGGIHPVFKPQVDLYLGAAVKPKKVEVLLHRMTGLTEEEKERIPTLDQIQSRRDTLSRFEKSSKMFESVADAKEWVRALILRGALRACAARCLAFVARAATSFT